MMNKITRKLRQLSKRASVFAKVLPEYLGKGKKVYDDPALGGNVRLFYWKMKGGEENLGDYLSWVVTSHFRETLCSGSVARQKPRTLYAIGSILGFRCQDAVIWGSGLLNPGKTYLQRLALSRLDIRSVRGPGTRAELLKIGKECPEVYGDPAILMPRIYQPADTQKRYDTSLILHYTDRADADTGLHRIGILTRDYEGFIDEIVRSKRVISSSLHGVILAEAYGVPAVLLLQEGKDIFKYLDWYHSTGRTAVKVARSLQEALEMEPMPLPDLHRMQDAVLRAFPTDLWDQPAAGLSD